MASGESRRRARWGLVRRCGLAAVGAALCVFGAAEAGAQSKGALEAAKDREAARKLADEGQRLMDAGDFRGAIRKLEEAHARFAAPTIEVAEAEAHEALGELRAAYTIYHRVAEAKLGDSAPPEFRDAQRDSALAAARLAKLIPKVVLVLVGKPPAVLTIALDGARLTGDVWGVPVDMDPGDHTLVIEMSGRDPETRALSLAQGETKRVEVRGEEAAGAISGGGAPRATRSFVAPGVAFGIGAAGLVAGGVAGGLALSKMGSFRDACGVELRCPAAMDGEVSDARIAGHVATIGFAVAGVGAAMGVVLLALPVRGDEGSPPVSVGVSGTSLSVSGRF